MSKPTNYVYYADRDYAGFGRRYVSFLIDFLLIIALWFVIYFAACAKYVPPEIWKMPASPEKRAIVNEYLRPVGPLMSGGLLLFFVVYHIAMRRTRLGTLGCILTRMRIVDETGNPPPWKRLVKRFFLAIPFDLPLGASYLACRKHPRRQAIHDQIVGTWLVRAAAEPVGPAQIAYQTKLLGTFLLTYIDVEPHDPDAEAAAPGAPAEVDSDAEHAESASA